MHALDVHQMISKVFLTEARPHGAIGFRSIAPGPRRTLFAVAGLLTALVVFSVALISAQPDGVISLIGLALMWVWVYWVVPAWNRFVVGPIFRFTAPNRRRDREAFYRLFEAGFLFIMMFFLVGRLYLLWSLVA